MRLLKILTSITLIVIALLFIFNLGILLFEGKELIIKRVELLARRHTSIANFTIVPPFKMKLTDVKIEGLASAETVYVSPSFIGLVLGNIAFNEVSFINPVVTIEKKSPPSTAVSQPQHPPAAARVPRTVPLIFKRLIVHNGTLHFIDKAIRSDGISIVVKDIDLTIDNVFSLTKSITTNFELQGNIPWKEGNVEGSIEAGGWVNFFKKDIQATLKIFDIDGLYLYPYYAQWVNLEKTHIEKAKLNFTSNINGLKNNVTAQCHLELTDIVFQPKSPDEKEDKNDRIAAAVLDFFKSLNQGKIALDFTIRTKFDQPQFGFGNIKTAVEDTFTKNKKESTVGDIVLMPERLVEGTIKGVADVSKTLIGAGVTVGIELKNTLLAPFKRTPKQKTEEQGN